jgi:hypothetical protein
MSAKRAKKSAKARGKGKDTRGDEKRVVAKLRSEIVDKYRFDPRGSRSIKNPMESLAVNPSMPIQVQVSANAFTGIILAVISEAVMRGWSLNTFDDNYIYWAAVYQTNLLIQAAKGGVPFSGNCPRWLNLCIQAVIKTTANYRGGEISYSMNIQDTLNDSFEQLIGPPAYKHIYSLGVKTSATVNGLYPIVAAPGLYTEENGQQATQSLWLFLQGRFKDSPMHQMVEFNAPNRMTKDVSAFAYFENNTGGGFRSTGAWFKLVKNEVVARSPIFSVFSPEGSTPFVNRSFVKPFCFSGDAILLGGMLVDELKPSQLGLKTPPVIKYIDFLQFADVYARTIQQALTLRVQTAAFVENVANNSNYFVEELQCPLTFQNFQLLLRATLMLVYTDTVKCQGTYPRTATGGTDNEFVVYPCGMQSVGILLGNMMLLPNIMQENVLALRSTKVEAGKTGAKQPQIVYSALGQYNGDKLIEADYSVTYTIDGADFTVSPFASPVGEVPISLIDGYFSSVPDGYCCINDPSALVTQATAFNEWIQAQGDHFRMLTSIATDSGVNALKCNFMTCHWLTVGQELSWKKKEKSKEVKKTKKEKLQKIEGPKSRYTVKLETDEVVNSVYANRKMIAVSSGNEVFDVCWTNFQMYFVLPINSLDSGTNGDNTGYLKMSGLMREPRQLSVGTGSTKFASIAARNESYAALMVKTKFAQDTVQEETLKQLNAEGEAGVLGSMTKVIAGTVGHAAVDVASDMLGSVIPW